MPKLKTNKASVKRFRKTANGFKHRRTGRNHLLLNKSNRRKRALRGMVGVADQDVAKVKRLMPYDN
ncbi:MAG: 50S ribosomal protein L35 [Gammaproteobacteria bacterium]|nr:50S ribosomal protein L35 [Gammaproteobacteria bacterium]